MNVNRSEPIIHLHSPAPSTQYHCLQYYHECQRSLLASVIRWVLEVTGHTENRYLLILSAVAAVVASLAAWDGYSAQYKYRITSEESYRFDLTRCSSRRRSLFLSTWSNQQKDSKSRKKHKLMIISSTGFSVSCILFCHCKFVSTRWNVMGQHDY